MNIRKPRYKHQPWGLGMILVLAICLAWAPARGAAGNPRQTSDNVLRATLANGLRVVVVRNRLAPVVTTVVNYLVGSNEAPAGFPGTAHAQEHMMFRGSPGLSADQLANITAAMGGMFDADTQQTVTQYFLSVPAEDLDVALHIEAIRMRGVLDSQQLWDRERGAIEQEVAQDLSIPDYVLYTKLLATMFKGTPYAQDALGTRASFDKTSGAMLKKFHDTWYVPNNAILVIVGDVQPGSVLEQVKKIFAHIPAKTLPARPGINLSPVKPGIIRLKTDRPEGLALISFRMPGYDSSDFAASQVLADVLNSRRGDLYALVPQGKALHAGLSVNFLPGAGLAQAVAVFAKDADPQILVKRLRKILSKIAKGGLPDDLVKAAKRRALTEMELQKNAVSDLAMAWSRALAVEGRQSPAEDAAAIQRVSTADVNRAARRYLDLDHAVVAILTPRVSAKTVSAKGFGGRESFAPQQTAAVRLPEWAQKALKRIAVPASTLQPRVTTLSNGLKLIVQPESVSNTVSVYGQIKNQPGLETPPGQEGVDEVLDQLFSFGTSSLNRTAFQAALDDIGADVSAGTQFSLQVLSDYFARGVQLLADNELHPALPAAAFKIVRQQVAASLKGELESPGYLARRAVKTALFPKTDPVLRQATPQTVSALTLRDVADYYKKAFRPDLTTIVVIGKISPANASSIIAKYFGHWQAAGPKPATELPPVPPNKASVTLVPDASRVQDKVTLAQTLALKRSDPQYYALQLGNHVLGGGFYATRLYRDLREKAGLVYYVSSLFDLGKTRGVYAVQYACDPSNVARAWGIIVRNLRNMQTMPVSPAELQQARAMLLRKIPLSEASVDSIARGLIDRSLLDLPLNEPVLAARRYLALSAEQVRTAFARWLRPNDLAQIVQGPNR